MKLVRLYVKSSGQIVSIEETAALRMAKASPQEYQVMELPIIEVTSIPEKKSAGVAAKTELNTGNAVPEALKVNNPPITKTTGDVLKTYK